MLAIINSAKVRRITQAFANIEGAKFTDIYLLRDRNEKGSLQRNLGQFGPFVRTLAHFIQLELDSITWIATIGEIFQHRMFKKALQSSLERPRRQA